jgi:hypothetical protein
MEKNLNQKLITIVLENIPKNVKPVYFLMKSLQLSRESAYRRLRGEIPFSVDEISLLSVTLGFSVDEVIRDIKKYRAFFNFIPEVDESDQKFISMLTKSCENTTDMQKANVSESLIALNSLPPVFCVFFENIFNFTFFKWLHQDSIILSKQTFSEVTISQEMLNLQKKIQRNMENIKDNLLILDPNILRSLIRDIQYFYQRKLISLNELELLREEMFSLIDFLEKIAKTGFLSFNAKVQLYLSPLHINANTGYFHFDNTIESFFWIHPVNPITVYNPEICLIHKKMLNALKRQSTLISQSNEMLQTDFFDQQRKHVKQNLSASLIGL